MRRFSKLPAFLLVLLSSFVLCPSPFNPAWGQERPNVLLVVTDDQGYGDASCYGAADLKTPVMDAVAARGARFTRFRVNPLCAPPGRAS